MPKYTITVNGAKHTLEAPEDMPLLWVLRDMLGLTGSKYGCGIAICGSCTALLNDAPIRTCVTTIAEVGDGKVTTIEGLSAKGDHPLQKAWVEMDVPQCGYCQAGQIMSAAALLRAKPKPTDADIDAAMRDNVCRCGTYQRIRQAIHLAAKGGPK